MPAANPVAPSASADVALLLEDVHKTFRAGKRTIKALDGITAQVHHGMVTGLIGPDGAGKTTLMRLTAGLLRPDSGHLKVLGIDVVREPLQVQTCIGYMPQRFGLYEDLTVQQNLDLYADLQGVLRSERPARYEELTHMTALGPFTNRLAGDLSGGMKQKLGLACTLVRPPRLLLLDEPTVGVDPVSRRELWSIVYRLVEQEKLTVLLSTSYLDEAERCQQVIVFHNGRLLGQGSPTSFSEQVRGRSFHITTSQSSRRALHERLTHTPGVVDAIIQGEGVRVVTKEARLPTARELFPGMGEGRIIPVAPRFEDAFIVLLKKEAGPAPARDHELQVAPASSAGAEVIVVRDVKRRFGNFFAVKGISFTVRQGEVFGLLGANGAGKSTTFRMLCGLLPASAGTLRVAGEDLRVAAAKARERIGYMAQRFSLYVNLSVRENLRFFSSTYGLYGAAQRDRIAWAIEEFELASYADVNSGTLPLGYKQRLALAAALMHQPKILFLDEPTSGVDPLARREFWLRINALAQEGVTVLVTTHFMEEAEYCDRLVIMSLGEILADGTPEKIKAMSRSAELPEPTMEDAFIGLIQTHEGGGGTP
jgi:ABC-2 type transport system ATP-binding protein